MAARSGLVASLVLWVGAFCWLLGGRYSPTHYRAGPIVPDLIEFAWGTAALVAALALLASAWRQSEILRRWLRAGWPLTVVSVLLLVAALLGRPRAVYTVILFAAAFGWTVARGARLPPADTLRRPLTIALGTLTVLLGVFFFRQQLTDWRELTLGYYGIGENASVLQNTVFGPRALFLRVNPEVPLFFDHLVPGVLPLALLWSLWPSLKLLLLLQVLTTLAVSVALYLLGRHFFAERTAALLLAGSWLLHPSSSQLIYDGSYGFTWTSLVLPLFCFALVLWLRGRSGWALALAIWAVLIKEESAIPLGMFGLYLVWQHRPRGRGLTLAAGMFGYFLVVSAVVLPALAGGYMVQSYYAHLGATKQEILLAPLLRPDAFWGTLLEPATFYFAAMLLASLLFLPLRKPSILLIGSLTFLAVSLLAGIETKSIGRQYQIALIPLLYWALAAGLAGEDVARPAESVGSRLLGVCAACLALSVFCGNAPWSKDNRIVRRLPGRLATLQTVGAGLDPGGYLVATPRAGAHFIHQRALAIAPLLPREADAVLLDFQDTWKPVLDLEWLGKLRQFQRDVEARGDLALVAARDGVLLYRRGGVALDRRKAVETQFVPSLPSEGRPIGQGLRQLHAELAPPHVRLSLQADAPITADLAARVRVRIHGETYQSDWQPLGRGIWPTTRWEPGKIYVEDFHLDMPRDPPEGTEIDLAEL